MRNIKLLKDNEKNNILWNSVNVTGIQVPLTVKVTGGVITACLPLLCRPRNSRILNYPKTYLIQVKYFLTLVQLFELNIIRLFFLPKSK
jgi:hypothetical protein